MEPEILELPELSERFKGKFPSALRKAMIAYLNRPDKNEVSDINLAIGNVSLPMHPAMIERKERLGGDGYNFLKEMDDLFSNIEELKPKKIIEQAREIIFRYAVKAKTDDPFLNGAIMYTGSQGTIEAQEAVKNIIASSGYNTDNLDVLITDGGSMAMELAIIGACGPAGSDEKPLMLIDPAYTNYKEFAGRLGRKTISVLRYLQDDGTWTLPDFNDIEKVIREQKPGGLVVIPYDNPTGQFFTHEQMIELARICVANKIWMISDEAYRELYYMNAPPTSIWGITDKQVPGIERRRISIETASKVWNACGLRIGAMASDNKNFINKALAEYTTNLCASTLGQYIFGALAHLSHSDLQTWYKQQRNYYKEMIFRFTQDLKNEIPGIIVSKPQASIYSVLDFRNIIGFDSADDFVNYCAVHGKVEIDGKYYTLLAAPMSGFYSDPEQGKKQMRIAYVKKPEEMKNASCVLAMLLRKYLEEK